MSTIKKEDLENLIDKGITFKEIAKIYGVSFSTIRRLCFRFNLKSKVNELKKEERICLNCGCNIISNINENKKFCNKSCSATFNNKNRKLNDFTKNKIKESLLGYKHREETKNKHKGELNKNWKGGISLEKKIKNSVIKIRKCKYCNNKPNKNCSICDSCKYNYYELYKPLCSFNFEVNQYKHRLDYYLVEKYGWYSPSNKGNNLNGVSKDHMYSVREGFINGVDPEIIKHPANCRLMIHKENNKKNTKCSITLEELLDRIDKW